MLLDNLLFFCERNEKYKQEFRDLGNLEELTENKHELILKILSDFLRNPESTEDVAYCFPQYLPILMPLAISKINGKSSSVINTDRLHKSNCVVLGKLVKINEVALGFILDYFESHPAPFETLDSDTTIPSKKLKKSQNGLPEVSDYQLVLACYNILQAAVDHFTYKWNWSNFYKYLTSADEKVKWVALKCVGIILNMSELLRLSSAQNFIPHYEKYLLESDSESTDSKVSAPTGTKDLEQLSQMCPSITFISGVLLPIKNTANVRRTTLIPVPSMEENLRNLALAVATRRCICLQGSVGSGKTALIEYLASITGHGSEDFVKVQLGDQTDSKMLLGTYQCTDIPGEFLWQPGVLTQAVVEGKWLLLEDIDSAALDVASVLSNLLESGTLSVPGYRDIVHVKSSFQLFVTQRLIPTTSGTYHRRNTGAINLLEKHWLCVNVEPLKKQELITIIQTLYPKLSTVASRMVEVFLLFSMGNHETSPGENLTLQNGRLTSTRDLMKWCSRAVVDFVVSSPESAMKIFQDAIDIFCCSVSDQSQRLNLATSIGHTLGIVKTKAEYLCKVHKPSVKIFTDHLIAGRTKLLRKKSQYAFLNESKVNFSFTRPSSCLLERIATSVAQKEPVLLVGETGTGKTSCVQYLAKITGHKLIVINMNQQSESADLLGGFKPVDFKYLVTPIREEFEILFRSYFAIEPNKKFLEQIAVCYKKSKWRQLVHLMHQSSAAAVTKLRNRPRSHSDGKLLARWEHLSVKVDKLLNQVKTQFSLAFSFIEGSLIKALKEGFWVLLDEINLANAETLECLSGLLEGSSGSLSLVERGDRQCIKRHENFTIFACMNPATDVGKKELPVGLRNRFTEFFVDELLEQSDLQLLVACYLEELNLPSTKLEAIVKFYLNVRKEAETSLYDGTSHKPHFSLRTLCRALSIAASNPCGSVLRSLYEAFCLSFLTQLDRNSYSSVHKMILKVILDQKSMKAILGTPITKPKCAPNEDFINFEGYWINKGGITPETPSNYILTESVRRNLKDLVRIVSIGKIPILLQGDTSVGKTSLITYLAKASGHVCVRINNHEHTDLQEYVGSYVADVTGKLVFQEGVLVEAMRKGHWIILDELNLAPSDVLEALNRVLDDNRELFIPETQETVKAHPNFMLFATQNPPGIYGGRKVLSRAFRNRFVELHFDEIPSNELQIILHERCNMPDSYCKQIINVMIDLQIRRKSTAAFAGKQGFITLRDLFRWGERYRLAPEPPGKFYDWSQHLADEGFLVLAAKVRKEEEADEIRAVIKKHLKRDVNPDQLFTLSEKTSPVTKHILEEILQKSFSPTFEHIVWTYHVRKMAVLVMKSCQFQEPVLLVGETGGGKTTICQLIAAITNRELHSVNCHMYTESSDFLGNLRPVRDHSDAEKQQKLFEWVDGPLIKSMESGGLFLADEISLADDSVLERLNSLLEPERRLLLAEKGIDCTLNENEAGGTIVAHEKFIFIGTMNPGGDYGKKELSPALRNRFTEIWCEGCNKRSDLQEIAQHNLHLSPETLKETIARCMLDFLEWLRQSEIGKKITVSVRDVLTWVRFMNTCTDDESHSKLKVADAYFHGVCLTYVDSLGSGVTGSESATRLKEFKSDALNFIQQQINKYLLNSTNDETLMDIEENILEKNNCFGIPPFFIPKGANECNEEDTSFTFLASTTKSNTLKLLRGLQLDKPILLEGTPGVGKTSLVSALAKASGHTVLRINLSDQTDVSDLFGSDLPVEGGKGGEFAWRDGPFLRALKAGHWILLDELNLASQSVLEGLNACLDHRGEIFIPELSKTFTVKHQTKLFGCQNPLKQGGARRGLPKSFLNRFTQVYVDGLVDDDLKFIARSLFPEIPETLIHRMVDFNTKVASEAGVLWGFLGSPWEMNLRDITRWCEVMVHNEKYNPGNFVELIYGERMRNENDKEKVRSIYEEIFPIQEYPLPSRQPLPYITMENVHLGDVILPRTNTTMFNDDNLLLLREQVPVLRNIAQCVQMNWMTILVGESGSGKSSIVRLLASLTGQRLRTIVVNSAMDTSEILGSFEQTDYSRHLEQLFERTESLLVNSLKTRVKRENIQELVQYENFLENIRRFSQDETHSTSTSMGDETQSFLRKARELLKLITTMKTLELSCNDNLEDLEGKLRNLMDLVIQEKCLNAGGKFEWVDSSLVKCLQDGSWLLIDQVNLCSPAVFDRLNGLMEPGGILSIGERGVDSQGNIVAIKPHKNFRLFLAMDPHYGEISRAMRNRGVEIHLFPQNSNILDLKSLLHTNGILARNHQEALLEIHQRLIEEMTYAEKKLTLIDLLHCGFLIKQQISRGFPTTDAFRNGCINVYIKSHWISEPHLKERIFMIIEETLEKFDVKKFEKNFVDLEKLSRNVRNFQENSKMTLIQQESLLLDACVKFQNENPKNQQTTNFLNEFFQFSKNDDEVFEIQEILSYLLLDFYEFSDASVNLRSEWVSKIFQKSKDPKFSKDFGKKNIFLSTEILSFDLDSSNGRENNGLALFLYYKIFMEELFLHRESTGKNVTRLGELSGSIFNGDLSTFNKKKFPLIGNFVEILTSLNRFFTDFLTSPIDAKEYMDLKKALFYFQRFANLAKVKIDLKKLDEISSILKIHYKWMRKQLQRVILPRLKNGGNVDKNFCSLRNTLSLVEEDLDISKNSFRKIGKRMRHFLQFFIPEPHSNEKGMEIYRNLETVWKILEINATNRLTEDLQIILFQNSDYAKMKYEISSIWKEIYSGKIEENLEETLEKLQQYQLQLHRFDLKTMQEISKALSDVKSMKDTEILEISSKVQLWPIYEFLLLVHSTSLQRKLVNNLNFDGDGLESRETSGIFERFLDIPTVPSNFIALLEILQKGDSENLKKFLPELFLLLSKFCKNSYFMKNTKKIVNWSGVIEGDVETSLSTTTGVEEGHSITGPILIDILLELLLEKSKSHEILKSPTLGNFKSRMDQLKTINAILWTNSITLTSKKSSFGYNDFQILKSYLRFYLPLLRKLQIEFQNEKQLHQNYFLPLTRLLQISENLKEGMILESGEAWILLGYFQTFLFGTLGTIDPVHKISLKEKYIQEEIEDCRATIYVSKLRARISGTSEDEIPRIVETKNFLEEIQAQREVLKRLKAIRPSSSSFLTLSKEISEFQLASVEIIQKQTISLKNISTDCKNGEQFLREWETWRKSLEHFSGKLESKYLLGYPDIVHPILLGLNFLIHGAQVLVDEIRHAIFSKKIRKPFKQLLKNLVMFPTIGEGQETLLDLSQTCVSSSTKETICILENKSEILQEHFRLTKSALLELWNLVVINGRLTRPLWTRLNSILGKILLIWKQQEIEEKRKIAEKENLYKIQSHEVVTEEEEIKNEINQLFPTYFQEFSEFEEERIETLEKEEAVFQVLDEDNVHEIREIHGKVLQVFTCSPFFRKTSQDCAQDYLKPLELRYKSFSVLFEKLEFALKEDLCSGLYTSLNLLVARIGETQSQGDSYDFYRDPNPEEVKQSLPVLQNARDKVEEFLQDWPDHPTLVSISTIIKRLFSFSVSSPVTKFLVGLELLLVKLHEWEENAHSGVSLAQLIANVTQQIISWRKLELGHWRNCLDSAFRRLQAKSSRWWFFLYDLAESHAGETLEIEDLDLGEGSRVDEESGSEGSPGEKIVGGKLDEKKVIESLENFVTSSSLVEFEARLDLVLTFHCHVYYFPESAEKRKLLAIFWNVYRYYDQFRADVRSKLKEVKGPIERKLRDFVKIARWNDISYWAVKEAIEKTHRTLHKFIREYETELKRNVAPCLVVKQEPKTPGDLLFEDDDDRRINPMTFLIRDVVPGRSFEFSSGMELISKIDIYLPKTRKLSKEMILMCPYPGARLSMEDWVTGVMGNASRLRSLEIDATLTKEKRKSLAKSILQQKRMALANYFKTLTRIGVSHFMGNSIWKNRQEEIIDFTIPPVDLGVLKDSGKAHPSKGVHQELATHWDGCERYYYGSLIKLNALDEALRTRKTDLGQQNRERCQGFSMHLMLLANKQKRSIATLFELFFAFRLQIDALKKSCEARDGPDPVPNFLLTQTEAWGCTESLKKVLTVSRVTLEQIQIYLNASCPSEPGEILTLGNGSPGGVASCHKGDETWTEVNSLLEESLGLVKKSVAGFNCVFDVDGMFLTRFHFEKIEGIYETLEEVQGKLQLLVKYFSADGEKHPLAKNLEFLLEKLEESLREFRNRRNLEKITDGDDGTGEVPEKTGVSGEEFYRKYEESLSELVKGILLVIQRKYKRNLEDETEEPEAEAAGPEGEEEEEDDLEEDKFRQKLIESLLSDLQDFKLQSIYDRLIETFSAIDALPWDLRIRGLQGLEKVLPLLDQYLLLTQFYLNEQVSTFRLTCKLLYLQLSVFLDLATNGFCVPKDLDLEEGDENGEKSNQTKSGMGLGEGEGEKDVSERIESEDQLDDAKPAEQEKEKQPEDPDCREEDKGIEMSEDFDGKLQDLEEKEAEEGEEKDEEEDQDDLDKEMGETNPDADQLDEEIWGDEEDKQDEEESPKDGEEKGKGEETGEKEMSAKDNSEEDRAEGKEGSKEEREQKEDLEQINEEETNDDQVDPYHGKHQPEIEPEPFELPEDLNLDEERDEEEGPGEEEQNPFDIDEMKESKLPPEKEEEVEDQKEGDKEEEGEDKKEDPDSSDEEEEGGEKEKKSGAEKEDLEDKPPEEEDRPPGGDPKPMEVDEEEEKGEGEEQKEHPPASANDPSQETDASDQVPLKDGSRDKVIAEKEDPGEQQEEEASAEAEDREDSDKGAGQSKSQEKESGHSGDSSETSAPVQRQDQEEEEEESGPEKRRNPGKSDESRSLMDRIEPVKKKMKVMQTTEEDIADEDEEEQEEGAKREENAEAELCQHIKDSKKFDEVTLDAATEEQVQKQQQASNMEKEEEKEQEVVNLEDEEDPMDVEMHQDEEEKDEEKNPEILEAEKKDPKRNSKRKGNQGDEDNLQGEVQEVVVEGEVKSTTRVERGTESTIHTNLDLEEFQYLSPQQMQRKRFEVETILGSPTTEESVVAWNTLSGLTESSARELSEKLRLVLEPTQASRFKGDYRTGKRLNMRKIIPYIASQFRKDKIWLRRTRPSKRDYQVVLALDDSSSMADNHSKELAFESLALISKAMTYLEVGELCVMSFGEETKVLHPLGDPFNEQSGARLIQELKFDQKKTMIGQLVDSTVDMFDQSRSTDNAKLLVVLSDGRGIFSEGTDRVNQAVRRARLADIFLVFMIVDNPKNKDSILDIRMPIFQDGKLLGIRSYMDNFPFPFYMILRDINTLPSVLSDALRQWFEVVGKIDV